MSEPTPVRKNDTLPLRVTDINNLGYGIAHMPDGRVVFVHGAVTDEQVMARVIKVTKTYLVAKAEKILTPSPHRLTEDSPCPTRAGCGGCVYRHITYAHELERKQNYVRAAFRKAGLPDVTVAPVRSTGQVRGYRNKAQYPVTVIDGKTVAGFYAVKSHSVLPAPHCHLQPAVFSDIVRAICTFCDDYAIPVYREIDGSGLLRHIYLREGKATEQILVCLVICGDALPHADALCDMLRAQFPAIVGILLNENREDTNVVLGKRYRTLWGAPHLEDVLCGKRFAISPDAFYQVNHDGAELLYGIAADLAGLTGKETLLDLYCGIGTIGLSMADRVGQLSGIELGPAAVDNARGNAERNNIRNATFCCGDATDAASLLRSAEEICGPIRADVAIVDPPRKGCTPTLIRHLCLERAIPRIVYVSCDPDTLARDCAIFRDCGYAVGTVRPVDMFPRTGHVESVCLLSKLNAK